MTKLTMGIQIGKAGIHPLFIVFSTTEVITVDSPSVSALYFTRYALTPSLLQVPNSFCCL